MFFLNKKLTSMDDSSSYGKIKRKHKNREYSSLNQVDIIGATNEKLYSLLFHTLAQNVMPV